MVLYTVRGMDSGGDWHSGGLETESGTRFYIKPFQWPNRYRVDPSTISRYTGLTDRNGEEIFEGDILHLVGFPHGQNNCVVMWVPERAGFFFVFTAGNRVMTDPPHWYDGKELEIIGDIHSNPELLESGGIK